MPKTIKKGYTNVQKQNDKSYKVLTLMDSDLFDETSHITYIQQHNTYNFPLNKVLLSVKTMYLPSMYTTATHAHKLTHGPLAAARPAAPRRWPCATLPPGAAPGRAGTPRPLCCGELCRPTGEVPVDSTAHTNTWPFSRCEV